MTHLHVHSYYSLLDGVCSPQQLVDAAVEQGMNALALTDHGYMYGIVPFIQYAQSKRIKPIVGVEAYFTPNIEDKERTTSHILLLAQNEEGYKNLCHMLTVASTDNFYYTPRISWKELEQYNEGIIASTACQHGILSRSILAKNIEQAYNDAEHLKNIFGDRLYVEIMYHNLPEEKLLLPHLMEISKKYNIPLVATQDVHYIHKEQKNVRNTLIRIRTQGSMQDAVGDISFLSEQEMKNILYEVLPASIVDEAITNTDIIVQRIQYKPSFIYHVPHIENAEALLEKLAYEGAQQRYGILLSDTVKDRLNYELSIIKNMGFAGYFLIVQDYVQYAKEHDIAVGPGRGSAAGSIVAYCLGITDIDPFKYGTLFERFLNPERISMPDIDVDFGEGRDAVFQYLQEKYGADNVAQIMAVGTMGRKSALRNVMRAENIAPTTINIVSSVIDDTVPLTEQVDKVANAVPQIQKEKLAVIMYQAEQLVDIPDHVSVHAAGVVISDKPLWNYLPCQRNDSSNVALKVVTQADKDSVEALGLLKMDLLGLKNLDVIKETKKLVKEKTGKDVVVDIDDPAIYKLLQDGDTAGLFQVEGDAFTSYLRRLHPTCFSDVYAALALFRPGTLDSGGAESYIKRKHGKEAVNYFGIPQLEPILKETYGIIVYQEQIMHIAQEVAGYTLGEADMLRRAIGKKHAEELQKNHDTFIRKAQEKGYTKEKAEEIFNIIEKFANYGFNKSHAVAYAHITMETAYLKYYYPEQFFLALLRTFNDKPEKIRTYLRNLEQHGYKWCIPDINVSDMNWTVANDGTFYMGLLSCKGIRENTAQAIIEERKLHGTYKSLNELKKRVNLDKNTLNALTTAGALQSIGVEPPNIPLTLRSYMAFGWNTTPNSAFSLGDNYILVQVSKKDIGTECVFLDSERNRITVPLTNAIMQYLLPLIPYEEDEEVTIPDGPVLIPEEVIYGR